MSRHPKAGIDPGSAKVVRLPVADVVIVALLLLLAGERTHSTACGPFFPNQLLTHPDRELTWAPIADFRREVERIVLPAGERFRAVLPRKTTEQAAQGAVAGDQNVFEQSSRIDLDELNDVLDQQSTAAADKQHILLQYRAARNEVTRFMVAIADDREKGLDLGKKPPALGAD